MVLNYIYAILFLFIIKCNGDSHDSLQEESNEPVLAYINLADLYNENEVSSSQRYAWPQRKLRDYPHDVWSRDFIMNKLNGWPYVVPWAKSNSAYQRSFSGRKRRQNIPQGGKYLQRSNDLYNDVAPKLKQNPRL